MKFFVIYPDQNLQELNNFKKNNQHLTIETNPIQAITSNTNLRAELLKDKVIAPDNLYDLTNLAMAQAHISLWKKAVETQSAITVFETNAITHKNFLEYQKAALSYRSDYNLMVWGYNLNWNFCVELMPCLPKVIYSFPGYGEDEYTQDNNNLIDIRTYQQSSLQSLQILKVFSFSGLSCYTISAKGAEYLLQKTALIGNKNAPSYQDKPFGTNFYVFHPMTHRENISIDIEVNRHIKELNAYISIPMLAVAPTNTL